MGKKKAKAKPTTLYRLNHVDELSSVIKKKYAQDSAFTFNSCQIGGRKCKFFSGSIVTSDVKWKERVVDLTGLSPVLKNETSGGVLLIPQKNGKNGNCWALSWGIGWLLIDPSKIDSFFGQKIALRLVHPDKIASLTMKTLDDKAKVDRTSIPAGERLSVFGFEGFGEIVTRVAAKADLSGFTNGKDASIRGSDSLGIPLGVSSDELIKDLDYLEEVLTKDAPPELEVLEQFQVVKAQDPLHSKLESELADSIKNPEDRAVGLAWPIQLVDGHAAQETYKIKGSGKRGVSRGLPTFDELQEILLEDDILARLSSVKIQVFDDADGESPMSPDIPARKWIACEVKIEKEQFFLHEGEWYRIHENYADKLDDSVEEIFNMKYGKSLPDWLPEEDEEAYNKRASQELGAKLFDRNLIRTPQNSRGFEPCDILIDHEDLVHVKKATSSSSLSHLFAQAANSAHSLEYDEEALQQFRDSAGGDLAENWKPKRVVFGIYKKKGKLDSKTLFAFSKVTLYRTYLELKRRGVEVFIVPIEVAKSSSSK